MPPIRINKDAPIKPDGITPQTATSNDPPPTRTIPASIPATTTSTASSDPPPPQPGARPIAPTASAPSSSDPPAPQPGPGPGSVPGYTATHTTTETRLGAPPSQFTLPPPSDSQLAGRSTTTSITASKPGPTTLNMGLAASPFQAEHSQGAMPTRTSGEERRSLEHPPGYVQAPDHLPNAGGPGGQQQSSSGDGTVGAAWNMLSKAGEALRKGEEAAWRAVRNSK